MSARRLPAIVLALLALALPALPAPAAPPAPPVVRTAQGSHILGKPGAPLKVVEYVSYTCPHCAAFEREGADGLLQAVVRSGKGTVEYRPLMRNIVDVATTLLVGCGSPAKFHGNHSAVLLGQEKWLNPAADAQAQRWNNGDFATRMRVVAQDMNLYPLFEARGYTRAQLDRCLANEPQAKAYAAENRKAMAELNVQGTPSFLVNGQLQPAHDWATLSPASAAATR